MHYDKPEPGTWVNPVKRGYKIICCDCGLVHRFDFRHVRWGRGRKIQFRCWRDERATAAVRREAKKREVAGCRK
jgi:hypothetical protein